jgi:hypothetical protein
MNEVDDDILRAWLLHRLADEPLVAALEQRVLEDDAFGARLRAIEADLIDDYARQRLDADDRRAMARWLLATPRDRARLRTAVALGDVVASSAHERAAGGGERRPAQRARRHGVFALATAAVVLLAVLVYRQQVSGPSAPALVANASTITLLAGLQRGVASATSVAIPSGAKAVRLQVEVADGAADDRYGLQVVAGTHVLFEARGLVAQQQGPYRFVEVALAPSALGEGGDALVRLSRDGATQPLQEWPLRTHRD